MSFLSAVAGQVELLSYAIVAFQALVQLQRRVVKARDVTGLVQFNELRRTIISIRQASGAARTRPVSPGDGQTPPRVSGAYPLPAHIQKSRQ